MITVLSALSPDSGTSLPSQSRKASGAWIRPKTSRRTAAARLGLGVGRIRANMVGVLSRCSSGTARSCQAHGAGSASPPDRLHDLLVLEGARRGPFEDDLPTVDRVEAV